MRFCPWYPLADADAHAPAAANLLQVRQARGLVSYPKGQSAMVTYHLADDARAAAQQLARELAARCPGVELWCRHLILDEQAGESALPSPDLVAATYDKLLGEFLHRFGAVPTPPPTNEPMNAP